MKPYFLLILTAVMMAFGTGYYTLYMQRPGFAPLPDLENVIRVKKMINLRLSPKVIIDLGNIYSRPQQLQLADPRRSVLNEGFRKKNSSHFPERRQCIRSAAKFLSLTKKEQIWESYRCGWIRRLPKQFFMAEPFMASNGYSYAYLAMMSGIAKYKRSRWVFDHLSFFHVLELGRVENETRYLPGVFDYLARLNTGSFLYLIENENLIMSEDLFLVREGLDGFNYGSHYRVYLRRQVEALLSTTDFQISNYKEGKKCFMRDAGICWGYSAKHVYRKATETGQVLFIGSIMVTSLVVLILLGKIRTQRREDETRRLVLRVLGHELRTPIASMLIQVDQIQKGESKLSESDQEAFLRLSSDVYRLQRLTEKSNKYLSFQKGQGLIKLDTERLESINDFFMSLLDTYSDRIELILPENDFSFQIDGYWLGICIKNLVENALVHGAAPVKVSWFRTGKCLEVRVSDAGKLAVENLDQLTTAFYKREESPGSGLGLHLVKTISKEMGGDLKVSTRPTTFSIRWKEKKA